MKTTPELTQNQRNLLGIVDKIEDEYGVNLRAQPNIAMGAVIVSEVANLTNAMKVAITERNYDELKNLSKSLKETIEKQINSQELLPTMRKDFNALIERFDTLVFSVKRDKDKPTQEFKSGVWNPEAGVYKGKMTLQQTNSSNSYKFEQTETPYTYMPITPTSQYGDIPRSTRPTEEANPKLRGNMKDFIVKKFGELGDSTLAKPDKAMTYSEKYMNTIAALVNHAENKNYDEMQKVLTRFENETKGILKDEQTVKAAASIISEIQKEIVANKEKERELAQAKPTIPTPQKKLERSNTAYGQLLSDEALAKKQYGDIPRSPKVAEEVKPQFTTTVTVKQTVVTTTTQAKTPLPEERLAGATIGQNMAIREVVDALKSGDASKLEKLLLDTNNEFIKKQIDRPFNATGVKLANYAKNQEVAKILQENGAKIDSETMNKLPKATNLAPEALKKENKAQKFASKVTALAKGFAAKVNADKKVKTDNKNNNKGINTR